MKRDSGVLGTACSLIAGICSSLCTHAGTKPRMNLDSDELHACMQSLDHPTSTSTLPYLPGMVSYANDIRHAEGTEFNID